MIELHKEYYEIIIIDIILGTIPLIVSESWNLFSNWKAYFLLTKIRRYKASFFPSWSSSARCSTEQQRGRRRNEWKDRLKLAIMAKQIWDISTLRKSVQIITCFQFSSVQFSSVAQSCPTLCNNMNRTTPGLPVHHQLLEFTQTHVHRVSVHPAISSSVVPFSSCPQSLPASESFPMSQLFS